MKFGGKTHPMDKGHKMLFHKEKVEVRLGAKYSGVKMFVPYDAMDWAKFDGCDFKFRVTFTAENPKRSLDGRKDGTPLRENYEGVTTDGKPLSRKPKTMMINWGGSLCKRCRGVAVSPQCVKCEGTGRVDGMQGLVRAVMRGKKDSASQLRLSQPSHQSAPIIPAHPTVPHGWTVKYDQATQRNYYVSPFGVSQWQAPVPVPRSTGSQIDRIKAAKWDKLMVFIRGTGFQRRRLAAGELQSSNVGFSLALLLLWTLIGTAVGSIATFAMLRHLTKTPRERQQSYLEHYAQHRHDSLQHHELLL